MDLHDIIKKDVKRNYIIQSKEEKFQNKLSRNRMFRLACLYLIGFFSKNQKIDIFEIHKMQNVLQISYNYTKDLLNSLVYFEILKKEYIKTKFVFYPIKNGNCFILLDHLEVILTLHGIESEEIIQLVEKYKAK